MISLDHKTIMGEFITLAGIDPSAASDMQELVLSAMKAVASQIDESRVSQADIPVCEHLAACEAVYEYALVRCSGERLIVSADGRAGERIESLSRAQAAEKLRDEARKRAAHLLKDDPFYFSGIKT